MTSTITVHLLFPLAALTLFLMRWFLPTEATLEGTTIWVAAGWLLLWPAWAFLKTRATPANPGSIAGSPTSVSLLTSSNLWLIAIGLLILGHVLSGLSLIFFGEGNKRAALNLLWEWIALGVMARLFWSWRMHFNWRPSQPLLLSCIAALALLGLYQHFVFYPQMQAQYHSLVAAGDKQGLAQLGIPTQEPARSQFLDRLLFSTEPFGFFALTNSFAGLLGVGCILWGAIAAITGRQKIRIWHLFVWSMMIFLSCAGCMILTKSRTAVAAFFLAFFTQGLCWSWLASIGSNHVRRTRIFVITLSTLAVLLVLVMPYAVPDLWNGATKSLRYRFEYWDATWSMIQDSLLLGHLGNFRQEYLRYKLPASSEEISDPHNLLIDAWANGGLLAFLGVISIIGITLYQFRRPVLDFLPTDFRDLGKAKSSSAVIALTTLAAFLIPTVLSWNYDERIVIIGIVWGLLFAAWIWLWNRNGQMPEAENPSLVQIPNVWLFAWLGLTMHLLGAGGMEMPALAQLWILLSVCALTTTPSTTVPMKFPSFTRYLEPGIATILLILFAWSTFFPVQKVREQLAAAEFSRDLNSTIRHSKAAFDADSFDPEPARMFTFSAFTLEKERPTNASNFLAAAENWLKRDPHSASAHRQVGEWMLELSRRSSPQNDSLKSSALKHFQNATNLAPTNVFLWATLFQNGLGSLPEETVTNAARTALQLHEQNERLAHTDKLLPNETITQIRNYLQGK
ncbi:O-antigen ligase family protein [Lacunimicrobium album]